MIIHDIITGRPSASRMGSKTGAMRVVDTHALFIMVGAPDTVAHRDGGVRRQGIRGDRFEPWGRGLSFCHLPCRGFPLGDVHAGSVKRVASAIGEGAVVISNVREFVNRKR